MEEASKLKALSHLTSTDSKLSTFLPRLLSLSHLKPALFSDISPAC